VALAAVFIVAGLAKLTDRAGSRQALSDLGAPRVLVAPLAIGVPVAELVVALALLPTATAWWGALGALVTLLVFVAGIAGNLARGRRPSCRCFGQLSPGPIGQSTLIRNVVLAAAAGFVVWQGPLGSGPSLVGWLGDLTVAERALLGVGLPGLAMVAGVVVLLVQLLKQQGRLLLRLDDLEQGLAATGALIRQGQTPTAPGGLPIGAEAPGFSVPDLSGSPVSLGDLVREKPLLLVFTDPDCGPCKALLPEVGRWQSEHADRLTVAVVSRGAAEDHRTRAAEHGVAPLLLQRDYEVADAYEVHETPSAVLVQPGGTIGSPVASGSEQIRALLSHVLSKSGSDPWAGLQPLPMVQQPSNGQHHPTALTAPTVGERAPNIILHDLEGQPVDLAGVRDSSTVVLFWSPGCPFCQQLLPDLKAWEADVPPNAPRLLVVSSGTVQENRALGLRAPVLLDDAFRAGVAFGADGTPSAVLLASDGTVASALAVGGPAVLALAGIAPESRSVTLA
jgi:thiol-disulfide isomerase/thioredoxin